YKEFRNMLSPVQGTGTMQEAYNWMSGNDGDPLYQTGHSGNPFQPLATARPHYDPVLGVGPYTLAPDESLKVAIAFSTGAVPEPMAIALGDSVKNGLKTLAAAKQVIYDGGVDSIQARFARAQAAYDSYHNTGSFGVPMLPDPPGNLRINSGPKQVSLEWDPVGDAAAYRVYRAIGGVDGGRVYSMVTETAETSYLDEGLTRGTSYYYYVTALDADGLESSHFFNRTNRAAIPVRPAQEGGEWVDLVRVVPNPFNIKGNTYLEESAHNATGFNFSGGYREQNTLLFVNIPEQCTIHIYNAVGDKIKTLEHTDGSGDERWSPVLTDDNIFPASGVYFYIIKATGGPLEGQTATGKFVMIR
ncbi:MAG TPA: fibronectin type III domain-containing protein, partial [bacterium]|nr:fibronectin type III domain-containing protein [bacterium]